MSNLFIWTGLLTTKLYYEYCQYHDERHIYGIPIHKLRFDISTHCHPKYFIYTVSQYCHRWTRLCYIRIYFTPSSSWGSQHHLQDSSFIEWTVMGIDNINKQPVILHRFTMNLDDLPQEIIRMIASYLKLKEAYWLTFVSHRLANVIGGVRGIISAKYPMISTKDMSAEDLISLDSHLTNRKYNWALNLGAQLGQLDLIKALLSLPNECHVNPAVNNNEPFIWAAANGHLEVVKFLLELPKSYGVDPTACDNDAIYESADNGHTDVVMYLADILGNDEIVIKRAVYILYSALKRTEARK